MLIADDRVPRNRWNMARVVDIYQDSKGQVRSVKVTTYGDDNPGETYSEACADIGE